MTRPAREARRSWRLPQGPEITIVGSPRLIAALAPFLDAHAIAIPGADDGGWTIGLAAPPRDRPREIAIEAFGERYRVARHTDGVVSIAHAGTPDQHWRTATRHVALVAPAGAYGHATVQAAYAACRRIGLLDAARSGMTVLHAAAVSIGGGDGGGGAVMICGAKGAGKTTLALALLDRGAAYLASDRVIVWNGPDGPVATGWIGSFRLAPDSLALALDPARSLAAHRYASCRHDRAFLHAGKWRFPPADLLDICSAEPAFRAKPRLLVELDTDASSSEIAPMTRAAILRAWDRHSVAGDPRLDPGGAPPHRTLPPAAPPGLPGLRIAGRRPPGEIAAIIEDRVAKPASCG